MSNHLELVEKLVEKTGLSYGDAKNALEKTDWDILEAIIQLEAEGKIPAGNTAHFSTGKDAQSDSGEPKNDTKGDRSAGGEFRDAAASFGNCIKDIVDKGNRNYLEMHKDGERKISLPVTVFVILLCFTFWVTIPLIIISLFFNCRYSFTGREMGKDSVNSVMNKASGVAESIKKEFKSDSEDGK